MKMSKGFTLLELMIAITLGLLITAASIMLFLSVSRNYSAQKANSDIQGNGVFGVPHMLRQLREVPSEGGVLLNDKGNQADGTNFTVGTNSDVLTVRYIVKPSQMLANNNNLVTCQGITIQSILTNQLNDQIIEAQKDETDEVKKQKIANDLKANFNFDQPITVIEQYYLRQNGINCRALVNNNNLPALTANTIGTLIIPSVDYFHVQLITRNQGLFKNIDLPTNLAAGNQVVGLQIGILLRSAHQIQGASYINTANNIQVLNNSISLNTGASSQLLRQVVVQTIAIRN